LERAVVSNYSGFSDLYDHPTNSSQKSSEEKSSEEKSTLTKSGRTVTVTPEKIYVRKLDFDRALEEIVPAFGVSKDKMQELTPQCGFISFSEEVSNFVDLGTSYMKQLGTNFLDFCVSKKKYLLFFCKNCPRIVFLGLYTHIFSVESPMIRLMTGIIIGKPGSGKTSLAAKLAEKSDIPMVRYVSPEDFSGMTDLTIAGEIKGIFRDLHR
jgi:vesicle-fusing ATPase